MHVGLLLGAYPFRDSFKSTKDTQYVTILVRYRKATKLKLPANESLILQGKQLFHLLPGTFGPHKRFTHQEGIDIIIQHQLYVFMRMNAAFGND